MYEEVAHQAKLDPRTSRRFVAYMRSRWSDTEEQKCRDGYAAEWARRFKLGVEWGYSDRVGQAVLEDIHEQMKRP